MKTFINFFFYSFLLAVIVASIVLLISKATTKSIAQTVQLPYAKDDFNKGEINNTWGDAQNGGKWALFSDYVSDSPANAFSLSKGLGHITNTSSSSATLRDVVIEDVDIKTKVGFTSTLKNTKYNHISILIRQQNEAEPIEGNKISGYEGSIILNQNNTLSIQAGYTGTNEKKFGNPVQIASQYTPLTYYWMRMQIVGKNPTTIKLKAWKDGTIEPTEWQYSTQDNTPAFQKAGFVGVSTQRELTIENTVTKRFYKETVLIDSFEASSFTPNSNNSGPICTPKIVGDLNCDEQVDMKDFVLFRTAFIKYQNQ